MIYLELNSGHKMPALGLGTWLTTDNNMDATIAMALSLGYRHFDTAILYDNEQPLGRALKTWIDDGKCRREDIFVVTKLPPEGMYIETVERYLKQSLENLQLDYIDLYLMHSPHGMKSTERNKKPDDMEMDSRVDRIAVWKYLETQVENGLIKSLGVSNFTIDQLTKLYDVVEIKPSCHQIELHLYQQQIEMVSYCVGKNIAVVAYSPLASPALESYYKSEGFDKKIKRVLENANVVKIADKYKKKPAQILLRHILQKGLAAIPKSTNPQRLAQNISIFNFELADEDVAVLNAMDLKIPAVGDWEPWTWLCPSVISESYVCQEHS